tara:strand:- start:212 stop:1210 length:999 start_codon:yes stop_codon:yes gene_type:complete
MATAIDFTEFLLRAREVHGDRYDYSQAKDHYTTLKGDNIPIVCQEHGVFWQRPSNHTHRGQGCPTCAGSEIVDFQEFLVRVAAVHGDEYVYEEAEEHYTSFKGAKIPVLCPKHGYRFWIKPSHHVSRGQGCPYCAVDRRNPLNAPIDTDSIDVSHAIEEFLAGRLIESKWLEFKSSVWQAYNGLTGDILTEDEFTGTVEDNVLKTICAFLNTNGGTLFTGVQDRPKRVLGIEDDYKHVKPKDSEGFLISLDSLLTKRFDDISLTTDYVSIDLHQYGEKTVCRIEVKPSTTPRWVILKGEKEAFYRRGSGGSEPVTPRQQADWITKERFPDWN